jgi:hypothetical protein
VDGKAKAYARASRSRQRERLLLEAGARSHHDVSYSCRHAGPFQRLRPSESKTRCPLRFFLSPFPCRQSNSSPRAHLPAPTETHGGARGFCFRRAVAFSAPSPTRKRFNTEYFVESSILRWHLGRSSNCKPDHSLWSTVVIITSSLHLLIKKEKTKKGL